MNEEGWMERPVTACPDCAGELDLTAAEPGDTITCAGCGSEWVVVSIDPPEVEPAEEDL